VLCNEVMDLDLVRYSLVAKDDVELGLGSPSHLPPPPRELGCRLGESEACR